ncbi:MAG: DUF6152 family protein [Steroidobacteraceae bacterium]
MKHNSWIHPLFAVTMLTASTLALAHHSFAMFDFDRTIDVRGTMRALEWQNPHSWIWVDVDKGDGQVESWGGEFAGGPSNLPREGFTRTTVQPGDEIIITLHPAKDGQKAGSVAKIVTVADGKVVFVARSGPSATTAPAPAN